MKKKTLRILLVDDDGADRELFREAIETIGETFTITEAANGEVALQLLAQAKELPHLIILDLNMPVKDGRETLAEIKKHDFWKYIPVCIMSTSNAHFDVLNAYNNGANLFMVKPLDFKELVDMLTSFFTLFGNYIALPEGKRSYE